MKTLISALGIAYCILNTQPSAFAQGKRRPKVIVKFDERLYVKLAVNLVSRDSIVVVATFVNSSDRAFFLYKFLLPSGSLMENNVLDFITENRTGSSGMVAYGDSSKGDYYEGTRMMAPCVIPVLNKSNFVTLAAGDSLKFSVNAARFYNFRPFLANGRSQFSVAYRALFPFVNSDLQQIFEIDKDDKKKKPVFYSLGMKKASEGDTYLFQRIRFVIP
jgi:hypothetical protein